MQKGVNPQFTPSDCSICSPKDIPSEFMVRESDDFEALSLSLCCYNSNRNWPRVYSKQNIQEFVQELAPVFKDFIWGLLQFPDALKANHHSGLRAIYGLSLWRVPLQGFGGFYLCRLIAQVSHQIDPRQYACAGHSPRWRIGTPTPGSVWSSRYGKLWC